MRTFGKVSIDIKISWSYYEKHFVSCIHLTNYIEIEEIFAQKMSGANERIWLNTKLLGIKGNCGVCRGSRINNFIHIFCILFFCCYIFMNLCFRGLFSVHFWERNFAMYFITNGEVFRTSTGFGFKLKVAFELTFEL